MWIPKKNEEIKNENIKKEKSARKTGLISAIFFFILYIIVSKYIGTKGRIGGDSPLGPTMNWNEILDFLPVIFFLSLFLGLSVYLFERKFRQVSSLLCDSCGKIKRFDKIKDCDCGGHFVFLDDMKWVDNDETHKKE